jgi:hypothetical protein
MPTNRPHYESFAEMPPGLRHYVFTPEFNKADELIRDDYALSKEQTELIGDKVMDAIFNDTSLGQALADIKQALVPTPVPDDRWKDLVADILKLELWPIRELFGEEMTTIISQGEINTAGWPSTGVLLNPLTYSGAATEIAARAGFSLLGPHMRERLRDLVMSRVKGIRTDAQVKETMLRQGDFGGLGFDATMADKTIAVMAEVLDSVQVMSEQEYADWLAEEAKRKTETQDAAGDEESDPEIAALKANMQVAARPPSVLEQAIETAWQKITTKPTDEYLEKRLRNIISSRLRDVRSATDLLQLLQRDSKVGGMGYSPDEADGLAAQIEASYTEFRQAIMAEEKQKLDSQLTLQKQKIEERKKREAEEHARWYQEKVLAKKNAEEHKKKVAEQFLQIAQQTAAHPVDTKAKQVEAARFGPMVAATPAVTTPGKATGPVSAPPAQIKVSAATAALQKQAADLKPRLEDVRGGAPRLVGLAQELRALTLVEFRRLGPPEVSTQKIMQKIDTLAQESFEKRLEGIKAWQNCPLQQSYLNLVAQSFKAGKPVDQLSEDLRKTGQDAPTAAEISAIISLNSKLHF